MRNSLSLSMLIIGLAVLSGCGPKVTPIQPETPVQASSEKDPFLKQLATLPLEQRQNFVKSHRQEVGRIVGNAQLLSHLQRIMAGTGK